MGAGKIEQTESIYGQGSYDFKALEVRSKYRQKMQANADFLTASLIPDIERIMREDGSTANGRGWEMYIGRIKPLLDAKLQHQFYISEIKAALKQMQSDGWVYFKRKSPQDKSPFSTWILLRMHDCHLPQHLGYDWLEAVPVTEQPTVAQCRYCYRQYEYIRSPNKEGYWRPKDDPDKIVLEHA